MPRRLGLVSVNRSSARAGAAGAAAAPVGAQRLDTAGDTAAPTRSVKIDSNSGRLSGTVGAAPVGETAAKACAAAAGPAGPGPTGGVTASARATSKRLVSRFRTWAAERGAPAAS